MAFGRQCLHNMPPRQRGGAAIEFFILFPLLLLLLYIAVSYAILFWAYQGLNGISAELAGQIIRQEWFEESEESPGSYQLDMVEINAALAALRGSTGGPASKAEWCSDSPAIGSVSSAEGGDGIERLSVCLKVEEGLLPQVSLFGIEVPHRSDLRVTSTLRIPQ